MKVGTAHSPRVGESPCCAAPITSWGEPGPRQIRDAIEQSVSPGSQTFEQALYKLFKAGHITKEEALRNADSASNLSSLIDYSQTSKVKAYDPNAKQPSPPPSSKADFEGIKLNIEVPPKT